MKLRIGTKSAIAGLILSWVAFAATLTIVGHAYVQPMIMGLLDAGLRSASVELPPEIEVARLIIAISRDDKTGGGVRKSCGAKVFQLTSSMVGKLRTAGLDVLRDARRRRGHDPSDRTFYGPWKATPIKDDIFVSDRALSAHRCSLPTRYRSIAEALIDRDGGYYAESRFDGNDVLLLIALDAQLVFQFYSTSDFN